VRLEDLGAEYQIEDDGLMATSSRSGDAIRLGDRMFIEVSDSDCAILRRTVYAKRVRSADEAADDALARSSALARGRDGGPRGGGGGKGFARGGSGPGRNDRGRPSAGGGERGRPDKGRGSAFGGGTGRPEPGATKGKGKKSGGGRKPGGKKKRR
jgi:hypothetical protein